MDVTRSNLGYLLDSDDEPLRLERQARIYGFQDDLRHLAFSGAERVLDAGCGAGVITRAVARALPQGNVIGIDREPRYVDYARCKAASEQLSNIEFQVADVLSLPFSGGTFDVLWSKHLLQWVKERDAAIREFKRVVRPGGRVICCNFDGLWDNPYPADSLLQRDLDLWFAGMEAEVGYDRFLGRKLASMLSGAGLVDVCVDFLPDRAYGGFGGDLEKRWNWERQWASAGHLAFLSVWQAIERGEPLEEARALAARNAKIARQSHNDAVYQTIQLELQFIASLQGRTSDPLKFDAAGFDEGASLATIAKAAFGCGIVFHPILKQILAFLHGRHAEALNAARLAEPMIGAAMATPIEATHHFYHALTLTALYLSAPLSEQAQFAILLDGILKKLKLWADNCPQNYHDRYALVKAEIARIEGRPSEAMDLYEEAIRSARDNGFVQQEALAFEMAAQFYATRGFATFAHAYLRNARDGYLRWGAQGKVRQLDETYPRLRDEPNALHAPAAIAETVEHLDLGTVVKVSEAISGEIVLEKLIDTLMRTAIEHAGAERGLLILPRGEEQRIEAEVITRGNEVIVDLRQASVTAVDLPESVFRYVLRTKESVLLQDASGQNPFSADDYIREHHARSVLCLPILKQAKLLGVLYLENNLTPHAFTPARMAVLKLLASEAAISIENARLYRDLGDREGRIRRLVDANIIGIIICDINGRILEANDAFLRIVGYDRRDLVSQRVRWTDMTPPEWRERDRQQLVPELMMTGSLQPFEKEFFRKDGSRVPVLIGVANFEDGYQGVAFVLDLTERKHAADALRALQTDLAHANRLATMGQLTASIAHEVNQPIGAARNNAHAALRFLGRDPPDLAEVREAIECVVSDTYRAGDIISGIRDQVKKVPPRKTDVDLNQAIEEVVALVRGELSKHRVSVQTRLAEGLSTVQADRVQLQQVMMNLILNAIEAISSVDDEARELVISTESTPAEGVLVAIGDSGPGVAPEDRKRIFESFFTTKPDGVGIGLSICRSIVDAHSGRLWVDAHQPRGAVFRFTLPAHS